jgi:hypothetical protein
MLERGIITFINLYLLLSFPLSLLHVLDPKEIPTSKNFGFFVIEDHVWFEDRWMVASLCDE